MSNRLTRLFPNIDELEEEKDKDKNNDMEIDQVTEILARIDNDTIPLELQFFNGCVNQTFENYTKTFGLSPSNLEFLEFLQSDECKEILLTNKLQIHIETGNIYYDNQDTNESIYDFFLNNKIQIKGLLIMILILLIVTSIILIG